MDLTKLLTELDAGHPGGDAYSADAATATAELNAVNRTKNLSSLSGDEMFAATDDTEFIALSDHKQSLWVTFCARTSIDPFGAANVALVTHIFTGGSDTITALAALRKVDASRADELGLGTVRVGHVELARGEV